MKSAQELRLEQNARARISETHAVKRFAATIEACVDDASVGGLHQVSVAVPERLEASAAAIGLGYEKLGYRVSIKSEKGYFGTGLYKRPTTYITLAW